MGQQGLVQVPAESIVPYPKAWHTAVAQKLLNKVLKKWIKLLLHLFFAAKITQNSFCFLPRGV
jgi:hypothetical protein